MAQSPLLWQHNYSGRNLFVARTSSQNSKAGALPSLLQWPSYGLNLTRCYSEALSFCKVPECGAIMLLEVRQVGLLGLLLWQECHKRRKSKSWKWKKKAYTRRKRSSRSLPLNTLDVLPHKELGYKGFDMSFQGLLQEMGVTVEMETSAGASRKEQTMSFLILCSTATSDSKVWECLIFKSQRKG